MVGSVCFVVHCLFLSLDWSFVSVLFFFCLSADFVCLFWLCLGIVLFCRFRFVNYGRLSVSFLVVVFLSVPFVLSFIMCFYFVNCIIFYVSGFVCLSALLVHLSCFVLLLSFFVGSILSVLSCCRFRLLCCLLFVFRFLTCLLFLLFCFVCLPALFVRLSFFVLVIVFFCWFILLSAMFVSVVFLSVPFMLSFIVLVFVSCRVFYFSFVVLFDCPLCSSVYQFCIVVVLFCLFRSSELFVCPFCFVSVVLLSVPFLLFVLFLDLSSVFVLPFCFFVRFVCLSVCLVSLLSSFAATVLPFSFVHFVCQRCLVVGSVCFFGYCLFCFLTCILFHCCCFDYLSAVCLRLSCLVLLLSSFVS